MLASITVLATLFLADVTKLRKPDQDIYAEIDLEMKAKALARCDVPSTAEPTQAADWHKDPELIAFLKGL